MEIDDNYPKRECHTVCCVKNCKSRYGYGLSFHTFPSRNDKLRWKAWTRKLKLRFEPSKGTKVCSLHFSIPNFVSPTLNRITSRMILKSTAIPDINLPGEDPASTKNTDARAERAKRRSLRTNVDDGFGTRDAPNVECDDPVVEVPVAVEYASTGVQVTQNDVINIQK
ncbi:THAP domain-containing protein 1-like [Uranotaenia lowii]|uniref:THAP domain-containing protein 1-like n=1 Tax=Uranotaenia lowii TaxID=190385 RepID=UPI0024792EDF|nr:THAP domain-containing protein 1-like [Uranotaenia lowii]